mmetsp:Transcript_51136/g.148461  ORF Transcript_51136/g.148461 Transcript_51136/m.148461 type:complete len:206 (+) Transcript_51136:374-991(+)
MVEEAVADTCRFALRTILAMGVDAPTTIAPDCTWTRIKPTMQQGTGRQSVNIRLSNIRSYSLTPSFAVALLVHVTKVNEAVQLAALTWAAGAPKAHAGRAGRAPLRRDPKAAARGAVPHLPEVPTSATHPQAPAPLRCLKGGRRKAGLGEQVAGQPGKSRQLLPLLPPVPLMLGLRKATHLWMASGGRSAILCRVSHRVWPRRMP